MGNTAICPSDDSGAVNAKLMRIWSAIILKRRQNDCRMESSIALLEINPRSVAIEVLASNNRAHSQSISKEVS
jgi:hypothetical protein